MTTNYTVTISKNNQLLILGHTSGEWANNRAFAVIKANGSAVSWGFSDYGDSRSVSAQLNGDIDVTQIYSSSGAFAALRSDGSVVTWGGRDYGGDSSSVSAQLNGDIDVASFANIYTDDVFRPAVTIVGATIQGETMTVANSFTNVNNLTASYQWKADGNEISGATNATYLLTQNEVGKRITATVSYADEQSATSSASDIVSNINDELTGILTITGTVIQGETLTAINTFDDVDGLGTLHYQWQANGININKATRPTLILSQNQVGKNITVLISYTDGYGAKENTSSTATAPVLNTNDLPYGNIAISGRVVQGRTLSAANALSDIDGLGPMSYSWTANDTFVGTGSRYTLTQAEVGKTIKLTASYADGYGSLESKTSAATVAVSNVNDVPTGNVTITGIAKQGESLTASNTLDDIDGLGSISYQWKIKDAVIGSGTSYTLTQAEVGKAITVTANYIDGQNTAENIRSAATTSVLNINDLPTGEVSIVGIAKRGEILTVSSSLDDTDGFGTIHYQWQANGTNIGTGDNYTLTSAEVDKTITVTASYVDKGNTRETVSSHATSIVTKNFTDFDIYGDQGGNKADVLMGMNGDDSLYGLNMNDKLYGDEGNDNLYGGYGNDRVYGNDGNDTLYGEQDADYLEGGAGNDTLDGGLGVDTLIGGAGNDTYYLGYDTADVIDDQGASTDVDVVIMPYQLSKYTLPVGIEQGTIAAGTGASSLTGNTGDNALTGNDGNNMLNGAVGRDSLFGGSGNDVLLGGTGNDTLSGGTGKDIFKFDSALAANTDKITDFVVADDTIQLENSIFTKLTKTGVLSADNFVKAAAAHDSNDYVIYNAATGAVTYDADGSGTGAGVQIALLGVNLALTPADFVII
ncbi:MAG: hypothetical protein QX199_18865 [Methylococcaceae bacterium]